jgi:ribosomal protein L3 glutamine methyltransferase
LKEYTIQTLIDVVAEYFSKSDIYYGHGTDNAIDEAVYLVIAKLNISFDISQNDLQRSVSTSESNAILELAKRRINERIPVAYLVNRSWFAGLSFYVDERVLIPRSPIAELIEDQFLPWTNGLDVKCILDIGTGSGCIAVASAIAFPDAIVDAVDINIEALDVARINIEHYKLQDRVLLHQSDLFEQLQLRPYDLIIANPPYVNTDEMTSLPEEYCHEPVLGLHAGKDGLDIVDRIIKDARKYLSENGLLLIPSSAL